MNVGINDLVRVVAFTEHHRGHGLSTAIYYLALKLVSQQCRVLVVDLSLQPSPLPTLLGQTQMKNLGLWTPPPVSPQSFSTIITRARQHVAGKADCLLIDCNPTLLISPSSPPRVLDYLILATANSPGGRTEAYELNKAINPLPYPRIPAGVVFCRVNQEEGELVENRLENGLPIISSLPADYILATRDDVTAQPPTTEPNERYVNAISRLATTLIRLVPLPRAKIKR